MREKRRKFDREFREGAVRVVRENGSRLRRSPVILGSTRARWAIGVPGTRLRGRAPTGLSTDDAGELKRLRSEVAELRMERDVLKRSVVLWVKEATR